MRIYTLRWHTCHSPYISISLMFQKAVLYKIPFFLRTDSLGEPLYEYQLPQDCISNALIKLQIKNKITFTYTFLLSRSTILTCTTAVIQWYREDLFVTDLNSQISSCSPHTHIHHLLQPFPHSSSCPPPTYSSSYPPPSTFFILHSPFHIHHLALPLPHSSSYLPPATFIILPSPFHIHHLAFLPPHSSSCLPPSTFIILPSPSTFVILPSPFPSFIILPSSCAFMFHQILHSAQNPRPYM